MVCVVSSSFSHASQGGYAVLCAKYFHVMINLKLFKP